MKKILIVDDEPNIVMTLEYTFKKSNYEVFIARDGQEALDILKTNPDLAMDVQGLNLTIGKKEILKNISLQILPVLAKHLRYRCREIH